MEHIPDDEVAAAELARVLKPGGTIAITVPAWLPEVVCWKLSDEYHAPKVEGGHVRIYTERELRRKLAAAGLEAGRLPPGPRPAHPLLVAALRGRPQKDIEANPLVKAYHRLLVWDMVEGPARHPDRRASCCNPSSARAWCSTPASPRPPWWNRPSRRPAWRVMPVSPDPRGLPEVPGILSAARRRRDRRVHRRVAAARPA